MRLFIAINFNDDMRSRLLGLCGELFRRSDRGSFSALENLHLTLAFLGKCDAKRANVVKSLLDRVRFSPFAVVIDRVGRFERKGGDTWRAGVRKNEALSGLQHTLTNELAAIGFEADKYEYSPHVTLGRKVVTDTVPWKITPFGETVGSVELMKSERVRDKLTYTAIHGCSAEHA
jgi:2'-5' RNA ligase